MNIQACSVAVRLSAKDDLTLVLKIASEEMAVTGHQPG